MTKHLQSIAEISELLATLFDRRLPVAKVDGVTGPAGAIASYRFNDRELAGALWVDPVFALATTCRLSLIECEQAMARMKDDLFLPSDWHNNFREIANICSRFFAAPEAPRVVLDHVWIAPENPPQALMSDMQTLLDHCIVRIDFGEYGMGHLHAVACA
jgi:hypothetical protein